MGLSKNGAKDAAKNSAKSAAKSAAKNSAQDDSSKLKSTSMSGVSFNGYYHESETEEKLDNNGNPIRADRNIKEGITLNKFKMLCAFMAVLSVFGTSLLSGFYGGLIALLCELISWVALPWYAWMIVRGYHNTNNVVFYGLRLFVLALICEVPYDFVTSGKVWDMTSQNPVFALLISLIVLSYVDTVCKKLRGFKKVAACAFVVLAGAAWNLIGMVGVRQRLLFGGLIIFVMAMLFEFMRKRETTMELTAGVFGAMSLVAPAIGVVVLHYRSVYGDGPRPTKQFRWIMYAWYPIMLLIASAVLLVQKFM